MRNLVNRKRGIQGKRMIIQNNETSLYRRVRTDVDKKFKR